MKICNRCKISKEFKYFYKNMSSKDGFNSICKICKDDSAKKWTNLNLDRVKKNKQKYHKKNNDFCRELNRIWFKNHPEYAKIHLESKFQSNMTWKNYGQWHIDHIIPLSSAGTVEEMEKLCHYSNLQPLWAKDNRIKSNKIKHNYE